VTSGEPPADSGSPLITSKEHDNDNRLNRYRSRSIRLAKSHEVTKSTQKHTQQRWFGASMEQLLKDLSLLKQEDIELNKQIAKLERQLRRLEERSSDISRKAYDLAEAAELTGDEEEKFMENGLHPDNW
jgi:vacuolar-type H+-ATPase subunit I/STV1